MADILRKIYLFLYVNHQIGFMRFCYAMLILCALSEDVCRLWMWFMVFAVTIFVHGKEKNWGRVTDG